MQTYWQLRSAQRSHRDVNESIPEFESGSTARAGDARWAMLAAIQSDVCIIITIQMIMNDLFHL